MKPTIAMIIISLVAVLSTGVAAEDSPHQGDQIDPATLGGGGGGEGGAGGDGAVLPAPKVPQEKLDAFQQSMTPEQLKQFNEIIRLQYGLDDPKRMQAVKKQLKNTANEGNEKQKLDELTQILRTDALKWIVAAPEAQQKEFLRSLPMMLEDLRKRSDPAYVSDADREASTKLTDAAKKDVKALLSDNLDEFVRARTAVLDQGSSARVAVVELLKTIDKASQKGIRLTSVLDSLASDDAANRVKLLRTADVAFKRRDELRTTQPKANIAAMVSRRMTSVNGRNPLPVYDNLCYFSFTKNTNGYDGEVALMFDNGGSGCDVSVAMHSGQNSRICDMGTVEFASIKTVPAKDAAWRNEATLAADRVYVEHFEEPGTSQGYYKFKVLELKPSQYVIIEWAPIPQDK